MNNSEASQLRDQDLVQWIENKLGDPNELWSGRQAASLLTKPMLVELETCFQALEPHVKLKIIQAVLHLSSRHVQLWREPLTNLLSLARRDADDWVETVADMYRDFPDQGCIRCAPSNPDSFFYKTLEELQRILKERVERTSAAFILPPDCALLSHSAIKARYGFSKVEPKAHFSLNKISKSQQLLEEVEKAAELQNNPAHKKNSGGVISSFPIKMRSTARKPNNNLPMRGIPSVNTNKISGGFTNEPKKFQRQLAKREGGAMLIDIAELPQFPTGAGGRRRRNPVEVPQKGGGKKAAANGGAELDAPPPENVPAKRSRKAAKKANTIHTPSQEPIDEDGDEDGDDGGNKRAADSSQDRTSAADAGGMTATSVETQNFAIDSSSSSQFDTPPSTAPSSAEIVDENNARGSNDFGSSPVVNGMYTHSSSEPFQNNNSDARFAYNSKIHNNNNFIGGAPVSRDDQPNRFASPPPQFCGGGIPPANGAGDAQRASKMMMGAMGQPSGFLMSPPNHQQNDNSAGVSDATSKQLKELLKDANKLTPVSYNLIASFLSGNRTNPLQNKLGAVVTLLLSELVEYDQSTMDGRTQAHLVETFFQMDYRTGEWKRLRKSRLLRVDEAAALQAAQPSPSTAATANYASSAAATVVQPPQMPTTGGMNPPMYGGMGASTQNPSYATNPPQHPSTFGGGGEMTTSTEVLFPSSHFGYH